MAGINAAVALHNMLLLNIFHLPLSFFDVTPLGRILTLFSQDVEIVDEDMVDDIVGVFACILEVNYFFLAKF